MSRAEGDSDKKFVVRTAIKCSSVYSPDSIYRYFLTTAKRSCSTLTPATRSLFKS